MPPWPPKLPGMTPRISGRPSWFIIALLLGGWPGDAARLSAATVSSIWTGGTGGFWNNTGLWFHTPAVIAFPNNGTDVFNVSVTGSLAGVEVNVPVTITSLTFSAPSGSMNIMQPSASLSVTGTFNIGAGTFGLYGGALSFGTLNLTGGNLQNVGGTVAPGNITLNGGKITGGTLSLGPGAQMTVMNNSGNVLDGVTIAGGLVLDQTSGRVSLVNGANFNGHSATLSAAGAMLIFDTTAFSSSATISHATINMDAANGRVGIERSSPVLTIAADATLRGRGAVNFGNIPFTATNTQLVNQGMISADLSGQTLLLQPHVISNTGTMRAINGATLTIDPFTSFTNAVGGTLSATGASTLVLRRNWSNQGALVLQDTSVLSLEGTFTTASLGLAGWSRTGGTVNIVGALNNTGTTLDLAAVGNFTLAGGNITGGTILNNTPGGRLIFNNNTSNFLDGVTIAGGLTLDASSHVRLRNDTAIGGPIDLANGAVIGLDATSADSTILVANTTVNMNSNNILSLEGANPVLTIASTATVRGRGTLTQNYFAGGTLSTTVDNQGTISADVSGQNLAMQPYTITNAGTMRAIGGGTLTINPSLSFTNLPGGTLSATGGSTLVLQKNWHNQGALVLQDTSVLWLQGSFTTADLGLAGWSRTGGAVNLTGSLNNANATLTLNPATGNFTLAGGTIAGGTLENTSATNGRLLINNNSANTLDGVTVTGGLIFDANSSQLKLRNDSSVAGSINFTANSNYLYLDGTAADSTLVLATKLTMNLDGTNPNISFTGINPTVTFSNSVLVRGRGVLANGTLTGTSQLINQGRIVSDIAGHTLTLAPNALVNTGSIETQNGGLLSVPTSILNQSAGTIRLGGGYLQVTGSQAGPDVTLGAAARLEGYGEVRLAAAATDALSLSGTLAPDPGAGGLAIKGDLLLTSSAALEFDLAATAQGTGYDFTSETGSTALDLAGSTLRVRVASGFTPSSAQTFTIITSNQTIAGQFGNVASGARITSLDLMWTFLVTRTGANVTLSDAQPSPEAAYVTFMKAAFRGSTDPALIGPGIDPDEDGVPNILEFALKGDPASPTSSGLMAELFQDVDPAPGTEFTLVIAFREGAVFTQQPDGSQKNTTATDSIHAGVQGSATLAGFTLPVLHAGPSFTAPAATALPGLAGTGWEYHTFYLAPAAVGTRGFLRVVVDNAP